MISIICDACLTRFQVSGDAAGTTVFCPKCGAKNGVPHPSEGSPPLAAPVAPTPAPSGAAAATGIAGEEVLLHVHPAMFRARPVLFTVLFLLAVGGVVGGGFLMLQGQMTWGMACMGVSLLGWLPLAVWKVANMGASLEVTNKRTIHSKGLLSKATTEVRHNDIKNFQIEQSFLNRVLGVGTVGISSSGQDEIEIKVKDMPSPYRIRQVIDSHRKL